MANTGSPMTGSAVGTVGQPHPRAGEPGVAGGGPPVAEVLLAAGARGKRSALPNAKVLIHQVWTGQFGGQASDVEIRAREVLDLKKRVESILADHTGQPLDRVSQDTDRDHFMTAAEAVEYGLIDEVLTSRPALG